MPTFDALHAELGGRDFEAVALSIDQRSEIGRLEGLAEWSSPEMVDFLTEMIEVSSEALP